MDTERAASSLNLQFESHLTHPTLTETYSSSSSAAPVEPVFTQKPKGTLMQYTAQSAQLGQHITQIILTSRDPQAILAKVAQTLGESFQVDVCLIVALPKLDESEALLQAADGFIPHPVAASQTALWCAGDCPTLPQDEPTSLLEHPILKADWGNRQPLAISDLQETVNGYSQGLPVRAVLKIHTWFQSAINGVILLARSQPHEWTTPEQDLLAFVSETVAVAFSHLQLTRQVLQCTRSQTLLNQLSLAMHSTNNLNEILQMAIASTAQALQVDRGLLLLLTYPQPRSQSRLSVHLPPIQVTVAGEWIEQTAQSQASTTRRRRRLLKQSFWLSESCICQQAFRDAPAPILITDSRESLALNCPGESLSILEREMMPALLIVPLLGASSNSPVASAVLGFLVLQQHRPRHWHTDELELVEGVSAQVSAAIIQNQTLQQVQSLVDERTSQLQHSLEIQAQLYERTRQQIDQLQELNQLKDEFMSTMSHELRTPLTAMSLAIRMLRQPTLPPERRQKYMEILEQECNKEIELINDLLSLQQLEADQSAIQPQKIDLMSLIKPLSQSFAQQWADKQLTLKIERFVGSPPWSEKSLGNPRSQGALQEPTPSLILYTDPDSLNRILMELLTNAGKYSDPGTTVHLQITHQVQPSVNQVVLTLSNTGSGISPEDLDHIFDKFRRGRGVTQNAVRGTGLGLALVKCLVQHLKGTIEVSSRPLENSPSYLTSFTLTLPELQQSL